MTIEAILDLVHQLSEEDQRILADTIHHELDESDDDVEVSEETKQMLRERIARFEVTGESSTWDEVLTAARARWGR
jgi:hypothetical protein